MMMMLPVKGTMAKSSLTSHLLKVCLLMAGSRCRVNMVEVFMGGSRHVVEFVPTFWHPCCMLRRGFVDQVAGRKVLRTWMQIVLRHPWASD